MLRSILPWGTGVFVLVSSINLALAESVTVVDIDASTLYIEALEDLPSAASPTGWTAQIYDTSQDDGKGDLGNGDGSGDWQTGSFTLGYGEGGESTLINDDNNVHSVYTRTTFEVTDPSQYVSMTFRHLYDDGYIAWLNGVEISRSANMTGVTPVWNALATSGHEDSDGDFSTDVSAFLSLLVPGNNTLAVGIWNVNSTSSDLQFTPQLLLADNAPPHVYLTWQGDTSTTMTVNYQTQTNTGVSRVYYDTVSGGGVPGNYALQANGTAHTIPGLDAYSPRFIHTVELTNLTPGASYYFIAGDPSEGVTTERKFRTIPTGDGSLRFVTGGDMGTSNDVDLLNAQAALFEPQFALIGGDVAYADGNLSGFVAWDIWLDAYANNMITPAGYTIPMVLAIGNHEVNGGYGQTPAEAPFFFGYFAQGSATSYFTRAFGDSAIVYVLDSGHATSHGGTQATWLESALSANTTYPNQFALYHVPLYPGHRDFNGAFSVAGRTHWLPLFDQYGLTAAFENHDHVMKRTKFLKGGVEDSTGTIYIGDGCWGRSPRAGDQAGAPYLAALESERHFWVVDVPHTGIPDATIRYRAVDISGDILDDFGGAPGGLTVLEEPPPVIERHPDEAVTLSVVVGGETGNINYEWMLDKGGKAMIPVGPNAPELVLDPIAMSDAGVYTCQISDDLDTITTSPTLLIVSPGIPIAKLSGLISLSACVVAVFSLVQIRRSRRMTR